MDSIGLFAYPLKIGAPTFERPREDSTYVRSTPYHTNASGQTCQTAEREGALALVELEDPAALLVAAAEAQMSDCRSALGLPA